MDGVNLVEWFQPLIRRSAYYTTTRPPRLSSLLGHAFFTPASRLSPILLSSPIFAPSVLPPVLPATGCEHKRFPIHHNLQK